MDERDIIKQLKTGEIDCNASELFFPILIKGVIISLNNIIKVRDIPVPHYILHTGTDIMYLENKGQDASIPITDVTTNSNESYIYSIIPRCIIQPKGINVSEDELTSPYSRGVFQMAYKDNINTYNAEFRRLPIVMSMDLNYYTDSYTDMLNLIQSILCNILFVKTFDITYLGQDIKCSYKVPTDLSSDHIIEITGDTTDSRLHNLQLSIDVETQLPVYNSRTAVPADKIISKPVYSINNDHYEVI